MKTTLRSLLLALLCCLGPGGFNASAKLEVSSSIVVSAPADFYGPLTPHGTWIDMGSYGRCWRPAHVATGWRPYCNGSWIWTDCGWYWVSDEPWAWACYHYGWWFYDPVQAWIWVPGIEWAPSWVVWRIGGGYCGWAPLAPRGVVVAPSRFAFVETARFHEPVRPATVIVDNAAIINRTAAVDATIRYETRTIAGSSQKVVFSQGPGLAQIQKAAGHRFTAVPITEAVRRTPVPSMVMRQADPARKDDMPRPPSGVAPESPEKQTLPPDKIQPLPNDGVAPTPPKPQLPRGNPQPPPRGKGKDTGKDEP